MGDSTVINTYMNEEDIEHMGTEQKTAVNTKPSRIPIAATRQTSKFGANGDTIIRAKSYSTGSLNKLQLTTSFSDFIAKRGFGEIVIKQDVVSNDLSISNHSGLYRQDSLNATDNLNISFCESLCSSTSSIRDNCASRKRFEISHANHDKTAGAYLTPTQRKNEHIRELRSRLRSLMKSMREKGAEIARIKATSDLQADTILNAKNDELKTISDELVCQREEANEIRGQNMELADGIKVLKGKIEQLKETLEMRDKEHEEVLLQMYHKGMTIAKRQREDELAEVAKISGKKANIAMHELMDKLSCTEKSLSMWQSLRRAEFYQDATYPPTEAEATLRFLRDSFYHFITSPVNSDDHLRAMIRIFDFTDVQKKKIGKSIAKGKKKL